MSLQVVDGVRANTPWIEPYPDDLPEGMGGVRLGPQARFDVDESLTLAFVAALQDLSPAHRSVITLHDVVGFSEADVAAMLDTTQDEVHSALETASSDVSSITATSAARKPSTSRSTSVVRWRGGRCWSAATKASSIASFCS